MDEKEIKLAKERLDKYLRFLIDHGGSDLHIKSGSNIRGRINGDIFKLSENNLSKEEIIGIMRIILGERFLVLEEKKNLDFTYILNKEYRFRVNVFYQISGISAVFRVILSKIPTIDELKLPKVLKDICDTSMRGLILVSGPTGSGKTTTIASMLNRINNIRPAHIITIEDPVEYIYEDKECIINQRAVGQDCTNFADSLRASLREDPDIIFVGEMRDLETIETALRAAETGHLVFSTIHTIDAKETVNRIISMFEVYEQERIRLALASVLESVISQRLISTKDGYRRPVVEVLRKNARIKEMIISNRAHEITDAIKDGRNTYGMQTFDQHLLDLFKEGAITREEALDKSTNRGDLDIDIKNVIMSKKEDDKLKNSKELYCDIDIALEDID
ncbi:type IV pili twitching motility protein PilT [Campylobacter blaseri]|uniref:Type IV pili twitching motility protein PilT n=2 Tax=Campylobacter blaseri TaxID=2042961 RepID=A0A2P8R1I4_9BACT|nr:type IV pili twitching motility protein PilT [Campylobacter blaseri]PSM54132.1 type IV pili twitching motility protein PilT [Campylobacter blaseri]